MKNILITALLLTGFNSLVFAETEMIKLPDGCEDKGLNIIVCPLADGVSMDDAVDSMKLTLECLF